MHTLAKNKLPQLLSLWSNEYDVYAPFAQNTIEGCQSVMLRRFTPGVDDIFFDYINFYKPVPDFSRPQELFRWEINNGEFLSKPISPNIKNDLYFGVRACDAVALTVQDTFYLTEFTDPVYSKLRENITIVAVNCNKAGKSCFCSSTETGPFVTQGADIIVTDAGETLFFEAASSKGNVLLALGNGLFVLKDDAKSNEIKENLREKALTTFKRAFDVKNIHAVLASQYSAGFWNEEAAGCIGCSGCTQLCPTCTCFQTLEETKDTCGVRIRVKDSCQTDGFTRNALWHNPRNLTTRVRYRIHDKLSHVETRFGVKGCVGCGRCTVTCPAHIDIVTLAKKSIDLWEKANRPQPLPLSRYEKMPSQKNNNLYTPRPAVITEVREEAKNIYRYFFEYCDAPNEQPDFTGQFYMLSIFGVGEIAISTPFGDNAGTRMEFCIKTVGKVTAVLAKLKVGDVIGMRGPYGRGFPLDAFLGKDVLIVGSGVGLAPVRTAIVRMLAHRQKYGKIAIIASASSYEGLIYTDDLKQWAKEPDVFVKYALARPTDKVEAHVGYINDLLPDFPFDWKKSSAILCASPRRIKAVAADLQQLGMNTENLYISLETHMRCGVGKCGHCKVGSHYICVDGPVFTYDEMLRLPPEY